MKFLHTADWQIGMKFVHLGTKAGESVRKTRVASARRLMKRAGEEKVDFVLVAGDTFEDNGIDRPTIRVVADLLGKDGIPVYVIPGNHDPLQPGSVWEDAVWAKYPHIHLLLKPEPLDIPGGRLYPCPSMSKHSSADPTAWISVDANEIIRIAIAHGTANGCLPQEHHHDFPIQTNLPERARLDYVGLGHIHSTRLFGESGAVRMAYCGTHEATGFGERDSGNALIVEIDGPGAAPRIRPIRTGTLDWQQLRRKVGSIAEFESLYDELQAIAEPEDTLIELEVEGFLPGGTEEADQKIAALLESVFRFGRYQNNVKVDHRDSDWIHELPPGYLQSAANELARQALEPGNEVAARAIQMFSRIWQEVNQ